MRNYKEFNSCCTKINQWYRKESKILTITTSPYNTNLIYSSIISEVIRKKGKVIYIWGNEEEDRELINNIKLKISSIKYAFLKSGQEDLDITFTSFENIINIRGYYDLCIIDDISAFSLMNKENIVELLEGIYLYNKRIIIYSIEKVVLMGSLIELASVVNNVPFVEPRIINTRINLEEDIPYALYDYLKWFRDNNRRVVIYVPTVEKVNKVYDYYNGVVKLENTKIISFKIGESTKKIDKITNIKDRSVFIITNYYGQYLNKINNLDIVILFSDNRFYSYKKILYLCAEVGKDNKRSGEVLMVSKYISVDMENAKKISRDFNKKIWERGFLSY